MGDTTGSSRRLIVLDEPGGPAEALAARLREQGWVTDCASHWQEALGVAAALEVDALLVAESFCDVTSLDDLGAAASLPCLPIFLVCDDPQRGTALAGRQALPVHGVFARQEATRLGISLEAWAREHAARRRETARRQHAEGSMRRLLASMHSVAILTDGQGLVLGWNAAATDALGPEEGDVLARPLERCGVCWETPATPGRVLDALRRGGAVRLDDVRVRHPERGLRLLGLTATPLKERERPVGLLILGRDLTDMKEQEAAAHQRQKLQALGQLAAGVAHEINTPLQCVSDNLHFLGQALERLLTLVDGYDALLEDAEVDRAALRTLRRRAKLDFLREEGPRAQRGGTEALETAARVVRALRGVAHVDSQPVAPLSLNRAVEDVVTLLRPRWREVAQLRLELADDLPEVICEGSEVKQALMALVTNAVQALQDAGRSKADGLLALRTRRDEDGVTLEVEDNGCGIPEQLAERVYDPFFTTREVGDGAGQGLSLAYAVVVQRHGGALRHAPRQGGGTTFTLRLPLAQPTAQSA